MDTFTQATNLKVKAQELDAEIRQLQLENEKDMSMISEITEKISRSIKKNECSSVEHDKITKENKNLSIKMNDEILKITNMYQSFDTKFVSS